MTAQRRSPGFPGSLALLLAGAVAACATPRPEAPGPVGPPQDGLAKRVQQATTAEDHAALAAYFLERARQAPAAGSPQDPVAVADAFAAALARGDGEAALALLDPRVLIHESGGAEASRDEYAAHHLAADMAFLAGAHVEVLDRRHNSDGELAWVATRTRTTAKRDGKPADYFGTESLVLRRQADGWRIVHVHWSSRPAQPKPRPKTP